MKVCPCLGNQPYHFVAPFLSTRSAKVQLNWPTVQYVHPGGFGCAKTATPHPPVCRAPRRPEAPSAPQARKSPAVGGMRRQACEGICVLWQQTLQHRLKPALYIYVWGQRPWSSMRGGWRASPPTFQPGTSLHQGCPLRTSAAPHHVCPTHLGRIIAGARDRTPPGISKSVGIESKNCLQVPRSLSLISILGPQSSAVCPGALKTVSSRPTASLEHPSVFHPWSPRKMYFVLSLTK